LPAIREISQRKFMGKALLVGGFEETWTKKAVHFYRSANYLAS
jgi:hypothetical protein